MTNLPAAIWEKIHDTRPLIYHLTNTVAANFSANITLAIGASPAMSLHPDEAGEIARMANGLVINTGTPLESGISAMNNALESVKDGDQTVLLDPVGYGVSSLRRDLVDSFLSNYRISVLKGNGAEIACLGSSGGEFKGMDSLATGNIEEALCMTARKFRLIAVATGEYDHISDSEKVYVLKGGNNLLSSITAGGCAAGSVICACTAVSEDTLSGVFTGLAAMNIASERAAERCSLPGSFAVALIDELANLKPEDLCDVSNRLSIMEGKTWIWQKH